MARVDIRPRCAHGRPIVEFCAECTPPKPPRPAAESSSLTDRLTKLGPISTAPDRLHLPESSRHFANVLYARGFATVTCVCGSFRERVDLRSSAARHLCEEAWGRHRGA